MSGRYRNVSVAMWDSPDYLALSAPQPNGRTCWEHLMTARHTTSIPGLFSAGKAQLAEHLGWELQDYEDCFSEIESKGMAVADWKARVVWLPNAIRHNPPASPNVITGWRKAWDEIPPCELRNRALRGIWAFLESWDVPKASVFREAFAKAFAKAIREAFPEDTAKALTEGFGEGFEESSGKAFPRVRAGSRAAARTPGPGPDPAPESGGRDDLPPEGSADVAWLVAVRKAGAPPAEPKGATVADIARLWQQKQAKGLDWPAFCAWIDAKTGEWVRSEMRENGGKYMPKNGWPYAAFATFVLKTESKDADAAPRSPATAVWRPTPTQDAVPPPEGFLDGIGKASGPIRRVLS